MKENKILIAGLIVIAALAGFMYYNNQTDTSQPTTDQNQEVMQNAENEVTVIYTENGFEPESVSIEAGTTVTFINESESPMWVASDVHPTHTDYPEFDQLQDGDEYAFTFTDSGTYNYHNHLSPSHTGVLIVE